MKRSRHTPEQVIRKLREAEVMLGEGRTIAEAAKELGISEQTFHRWRNQYGGMKADDVKRLKELEAENARLKRIVADQVLENQALREVNREIGEPAAPTTGGPDAPGPSRVVGAAGVPVCRSAAVDAAAWADRRGGRRGAAGRAAAFLSRSAAVGVSPGASASTR